MNKFITDFSKTAILFIFPWGSYYQHKTFFHKMTCFEFIYFFISLQLFKMVYILTVVLRNVVVIVIINILTKNLKINLKKKYKTKWGLIIPPLRNINRERVFSSRFRTNKSTVSHTYKHLTEYTKLLMKTRKEYRE